MRRTVVLSFLASCLCLCVDASVAAGVVFRYLPGEPALSSAVVAEGVETGPYLDVRSLAARGPGGWGLRAPQSAEFDAPGSTLRSEAAADLTQALGPNLTAEVWVRPAGLAGRVVLLTNRVGEADGFTLGVEDGIPFFTLVHDGQAYRVAAGAAVTAVVTAGASHWLAATAARQGSRLRLALYVDGHAAGEAAFDAAFPTLYPIAAPFFVGTEASGDPAAPVLAGSLTGNLFGAVVRDYVAQDAYLTSSVPRDGSGPYLGLPAFYDADPAVFHLPMDERIDDSPTPLRHRYFLPFLNDAYIPQGVATAFDAAGGDTTALVYVAYYHRTRDDRTGTQASLVAEIDAQTGHLRRAFRLTGRLGTSHAGGIAHVRGALFVSSAGWLERYPLPPYEGPGGPTYVDLAPDDAGSIAVESKASYVSAFRDTLWVGDWRTASDVAPYLWAYPLEADGRPSRTAQPLAFALPRNVQGVDLFEHGGVTYVFLSRNRNSREAEVLRFRRSALDRYAVPEADTSVVLPHGIEDLSFFPDGTLWTNSEAGAEYYQMVETWPTFYPFVYGIPPHALFPGVTPTGRAPVPGPGLGLDVRSYPNPFRGATTILFDLPEPSPVRVIVVDLLGRTVATLLERAASAGSHTLRWDAAEQPPGLYFAVVEAGRRRAVRPVTVMR